MNTPAEMIAVIKADEAGKYLESRKHGEERWLDLSGLRPLFNFQSFEFRIKPEPPKPREWWIILVEGNRAFRYDCLQLCCGVRLKNQVHVREVLPDEEWKA